MLAFAPETSAAAAAIMFVGPLTSTRLVDRREISGHLMLATACLLGPTIAADPTTQGLVGTATLLIGMWVLCVLRLRAGDG